MQLMFQEELLLLSPSTELSKKLVLECFTPMIPKAQWSAVRGLSVFGSKHKRL